MSISQSAVSNPISTHAPAGGATGQRRDAVVGKIDFYSRPCGRGDEIADAELTQRVKFLLTPLREGRPVVLAAANRPAQISTHAPAGGATR